RLHAESGDRAGAAEARVRAEADLSVALARAPRMAEAHFNLGTLSLRHAELLAEFDRPAAAERLGAARRALQAALATAPDDWPHRRACRRRLAATRTATDRRR